MSQKKWKIRKSKYGGYEIEGIFGRYETHRDALYRIELIPIIEAQHEWNMRKWKERLNSGKSLLPDDTDDNLYEEYLYTNPF
jgi:hypothetical protein